MGESERKSRKEELPGSRPGERRGSRPRPVLGPRSWRGLTYIEVLVAVMVLAVLATAAIPMHHWAEKRRREAQLRMALETMRNAIDQYKKYSDEGLIAMTELDQMGYPLSLDELVEGVEIAEVDPETLDARIVTFLHEIPVDPFTEDTDWGLRSYQDDWDSTSWSGENVYDVYSQSRLEALDGTFYSEW